MRRTRHSGTRTENSTFLPLNTPRCRHAREYGAAQNLMLLAVELLLSARSVDSLRLR